QVFGRDNGNIFICAKMRQGSRFVCWGMKTKNPAGARFLSGFCGWSPQNTLCYVNAKSIRDRRRTRNSGTDFDVFEYGSPSRFCPKNTVHTYSIYLY
ncbi:hypothetical protein RVM25_33405, partial [Enterobacter hormaechei subsp. xiangfangensis]